MFSHLFPLLFGWIAWVRRHDFTANNNGCNGRTDTLVTHLESRSYRQNGKLLVVSTDKVVISSDKHHYSV